MRTACLASSVLVLAACGGGAPASPPAPAPAPGSAAAATSPAAPAIAERERACEEHVLVLEAIDRCDAYPAVVRAGAPEVVDRLRRGWSGLEPTSVAHQELVRDECHLASLGWIDVVSAFGCALPPTPELAAWSARPRTPPLGSPAAECAGAAAVVEAFRACEGLPPWAAEAGARAADAVAHVAQVAAIATGDDRAAALHCRTHSDGLARVAAEVGCAGAASR